MKKIILTSMYLCIFYSYIFADEPSSTLNPQPFIIESVLKKEKTVQHSKNIIEIINFIDSIYGNIHEKLKNSQKLTIFIDPAHGKLLNGEWQGGSATRRQSCTNLPEEYYSILISREIYRLISANPHLEIKTTEDYLEVLQGKSDTYKDISFEKTVQLAKESGAFIIISEHLNNVSMVYKAGGLSNIPGIHITYDNYNNRYLSFVKEIYSGFLTLYNKLDASGFSKTYALKLKEKLTANGLKPTNWEFGAVGDTRFCYFVDFPVSVIYESGFISNPKEEEKLRDPEYVRLLAESQYSAMIENIKEIFGADISETVPSFTDRHFKERIELLKLSRIALYYLEKEKTAEAVSIMKTMEKQYSNAIFSDNISYYKKLNESVIQAEKYFSIAKNHLKNKDYKKARNYLISAKRTLGNNQIFSSYIKKYHVYAGSIITFGSENYELPPMKPVNIIKSSLTGIETPIILALDSSQSLEDAIKDALGPDELVLVKLVKSFKKAKVDNSKNTLVYSAKYKKYINSVQTMKNSGDFREGLYIVRLNKKLEVIEARRVPNVHLNPLKYQNHQYLKNSSFAISEKEKSL
jgi:N-acetylmuramoyl-L-alanine amidase